MAETGLSENVGGKLSTIANDLAKIGRDQTLHGHTLKELLEDVKQLRVYVIEGNGKPALLARVHDLEVARGYEQKAAGVMSEMVLGLDKKLDLLAEAEHRRALNAVQANISQMTALSTREAAIKRERLGWIVGLITTLAAAIVPSYLGK